MGKNNSSENFKGYIGLDLENRAKELPEPPFSADAIEAGNFVSVMAIILNNYGIEDDDFLRKCAPYLGKPASEIGYKAAKSLYDTFQELTKGETGTRND